ncbi:hypothetical protein V2J09_010044 [Rumex salicifolius]
MLDETLSVVSIWTSVNSWLTPAVLFVVLNVVIGTIAFTSSLSSSSSASKTQSPPSNNPHAPQPLPRSSSVLHRLRSLHLYRSEISPPSSDSVFQHSVPVIPDPEPILLKRENAVPEAEFVGAGESVTRIEEEEGEEEVIDELEGPTMEQVFSQIQRNAGVFSRSKSEGGHVPAPKKVRKRIIHKAASDISSMIGQFESPMEAPMVPAVHEEEEKVGGEEVDGKAEDFINRFRQQLNLQRLESINGATP